jgi:hypothetical protein
MDELWLRLSARGGVPPSDATFYLGFRVARGE